MTAAQADVLRKAFADWATKPRTRDEAVNLMPFDQFVAGYEAALAPFQPLLEAARAYKEAKRGSIGEYDAANALLEAARTFEASQE